MELLEKCDTRLLLAEDTIFDSEQEIYEKNGFMDIENLKGSESIGCLYKNQKVSKSRHIKRVTRQQRYFGIKGGTFPFIKESGESNNQQKHSRIGNAGKRGSSIAAAGVSGGTSIGVRAAKDTADVFSKQIKGQVRLQLQLSEEAKYERQTNNNIGSCTQANTAFLSPAALTGEVFSAACTAITSFISSAVVFLLPLGLAGILSIFAFIAGFTIMTAGSQSMIAQAQVNQAVEAYRPLVEKYARIFGMSEYIELILAVMMQESSGEGTDVMQAAEGAFNTKYPSTPNGISDPEYSIECGIQELKYSLTLAGCTGPTDMEGVKLGLQGYNFGSAYIPWALGQDGGYTASNASRYSDMMCAKLGWKRYGDKEYVPHVLRYYRVTAYGAGEAAGIPLEQRMEYLFPDGIPQTETQMSGYLTTIAVPIVDIQGNQSTMRLVVHQKLAGEIEAVFTEMAAIGFPIKAGTTGGYVWRSMVSSSSRSHHSYGVVIDLNWNDNPYISGSQTVGGSYRPGSNPYSVTSEVVQIWKAHGFYWGGDWNSAKDYMHFTYTNH